MIKNLKPLPPQIYPLPEQPQINPLPEQPLRKKKIPLKRCPMLNQFLEAPSLKVVEAPSPKVLTLEQKAPSSPPKVIGQKAPSSPPIGQKAPSPKVLAVKTPSYIAPSPFENNTRIISEKYFFEGREISRDVALCMLGGLRPKYVNHRVPVEPWANYRFERCPTKIVEYTKTTWF